MEYLRIKGGKPLAGEVRVQGSKNGALPLLAATVLIQGKTILHNCPNITDVKAMVELLESIGCEIEFSHHTVVVNATHICDTHCPQKQVQAMRSSVMLLGPLLARCKRVEMHRPGGCVIGERPTDFHELALGSMNVTFESENERIVAWSERLTGADVVLPFPSVGATENVILAAVTAEGITRVFGAAMEPEISMLCEFLKKAGADIKGVGTSFLEITGVECLKEVEMTVWPDRIVAGTYLLAAAVTRGHVILKEAPTNQLGSLIDVLRRIGACVMADKDLIYMDGEEASLPLAYLRTEVYPGFPTDLQSMLVSVLSLAEGESLVEETIFEDRFKILSQLHKMGAVIYQEHNCVRIKGVNELRGSSLCACELRGGAALVIAALAAEGESIIKGCKYVERGYENIVHDLRRLGAEIEAG